MDFLTDPFLVDAAQFDGPVLVTGAGGCIGSWVVAILSRSNVPVVASDLRIDATRLSLVMGAEAAENQDWVSLDVTDADAIENLIEKKNISAIIHLAGLQIPFCAANPAMGARVNVEGTINILEAARKKNIKRTAIASSVAALAFPVGTGFKETLYGAYKVANEQTAHVYWVDWGVPSVCIRPTVVYGIGRDQGMTSSTTIAIQAAVLGSPYEMPYSGEVSWLYAGEAAAGFVAAVSSDGVGAHVFDMNGRCETVERGIEILGEILPEHSITADGPNLPFPPDLDEAPLRTHVADYPNISVEFGIKATAKAFGQLKKQGKISALPG